MIAELTIVDEKFVNREEMRITDVSQIKKHTVDWDDRIRVFNRRTGEYAIILTRHLSIYEHSIVLEGVSHAIIHMFSKEGTCQNSLKSLSSPVK